MSKISPMAQMSSLSNRLITLPFLFFTPGDHSSACLKGAEQIWHCRKWCIPCFLDVLDDKIWLSDTWLWRIHHNGISTTRAGFEWNLCRLCWGKLGENRIKIFCGKYYDERKNPDSQYGQSMVKERSNIHRLIQNPLDLLDSSEHGVHEYPLCRVIYNFQELLTPR